MNIPFSPPHITEEDIAEVAAVLRSGWITTGPKTAELEQQLSQFCRGQGVACLNSATAGLELTLRLLEIGPGDEVITSAYTYTATAAVVLHTGATPVLVDVAPGSYLIDPERVARAITPRTKAIIAVDVAGVMCDYPALLAVAEAAAFTPKGRLQEALGRPAVIADAAHSLGALLGDVPSGCAADFSCFSFHAVKNLTTAEGGAVTWRPVPGVDNSEISRLFRLYSLHGQSKDALAKSRAGGWEYDILIPGYKCNLTDVLAALGGSQMRRYYAMLSRRRELVSRYDTLLGGRVESLRHWGEGYISSCHLYIARVEPARRGHIIEQLARRGVAANVHYKPLPMLTAYRLLGYRQQDFPHSLERYEGALSLPLHTLLTDPQVDYISRSLLDIIGLS